MRSALLLLAAGCIDASPLVLPPEAAGAKSALIAIDADDGERIFAVELEDGFPPITGRGGALYLFLYGEELDALGVPAGMLEETADEGRPLPEGALFVAMLPDQAWSSIERDALPASIREYRLPDLAIGACEMKGGCFRIREEDEFCQLPCVEPIEADPAPPMMAAFPLPPNETACPAGVYPDQVPDGPRRYVLAGGTGTGGMADPFGSIQAAIDAAVPGDVVLVGRGIYGAVTIDRSVSIVGACAETIAGEIVSSAEASVSRLSAAGVRVAGGTLSMSSVRASRVEVGGNARMTDAIVSGSASHNVVLSSGSLTMERVELVGAQRFGIYATGGSLTMIDVHIHDNLPVMNDGEGIVIDGPVTMQARKLAIERVFDYGIRVLTTDAKAELSIDDLTIRDLSGYGVEMGSATAPATSSTIQIQRMLVERTTLPAFCTVSGQEHGITDAILRDLDRGGIVTVGGVLNLSKAELSRIAGPSLSVTSGEMRLNDLVVVEPENGLVTEGWIPTTVSAIDSAMDVDRFSISGASSVGVLVRQFSRMKLGAGRIFENQVGVEVRADGFIYASLEGDVVYYDNVMHNLLKTGQMPE